MTQQETLMLTAIQKTIEQLRWHIIPFMNQACQTLYQHALPVRPVLDLHAYLMKVAYEVEEVEKAVLPQSTAGATKS